MTLDTLITAGASHVVMAGAANACNVYWQVSSSATLGAASTFSGSLFAGVSNTLGTTAAVVGRVVAGSGAVTLSGTDTVGGCSPPPACPVITLTPATLPVGAVGVPYSVQITASGGTGPYTFAVSSGTLPAGMTLTAGGLLSGTPTAVTSSPVTILARDGNGCPGLVTLTIATPVPPVPVPVPTLPETFVILLALGLVAVGYARLRRRPRTE
jgi:type VI secretion system secreted protein VgrG